MIVVGILVTYAAMVLLDRLVPQKPRCPKYHEDDTYADFD